VLSILLAIGIIALDQLTKWLVLTRMVELSEIPVIPGFFSLQFVYNPGASFGMLKGQIWLFVIVAVGAVGAMLYFLREPENRRGLVGWSLGLLMGGSIGNLIDRIRFREVVDFLLFYWRDYYFPNFNVADMAINVGVGLLILHLVLTGEKSRHEKV